MLIKSKPNVTKDGVAVVASAVKVSELDGLCPVADQPGCQGCVPTNNSRAGTIKYINGLYHECVTVAAERLNFLTCH